MALEVKDNILLDTDLDIDDLPVNTYDVMAEGLEDVYAGAVVSERGITGKLHVHRLMDGASPEVFKDYNYVLIMTRAQLATLVGDVGKTVYFMPNYRDDGDVATYRFKVFFESATGIKNIDPFLQYYQSTIYLRDNSDGAIG
jgi:hypothetical protein